MRSLILAAILMLNFSPAYAEIVSRTIEYEAGGAKMKSVLVYDNASAARRPAVVVFPEWWGVNDYSTSRAQQLAMLGYVALAADLYGDGLKTTDAKTAGEWSGKLKNDQGVWRERANAALEQLRSQPEADPARMAAIGYCFGGSTALELAYSGADLQGVVSFHGNLMQPKVEDTIKASILVCHGAADTFENDPNIKQFQDTLEKRGTDWTMVYYGHAIHSFTNPQSGRAGIPGVAYDAKADRRSWDHMKAFFDDIFAPRN